MGDIGAAMAEGQARADRWAGGADTRRLPVTARQSVRTRPRRRPIRLRRRRIRSLPSDPAPPQSELRLPRQSEPGPADVLRPARAGRGRVGGRPSRRLLRRRHAGAHRHGAPTHRVASPSATSWWRRPARRPLGRHEVSAVVSFDDRPIMVIELPTKSIDCTGRHPFWIVGQGGSRPRTRARPAAAGGRHDDHHLGPAERSPGHRPQPHRRRPAYLLRLRPRGAGPQQGAPGARGPAALSAAPATRSSSG